MLVTILVVAGALVMLSAVVLAGWWVRKIEDELDYPEAQSTAPPEGRAILQIGAGLSNASNTPLL
jgi:hypothetical protein